MSNAKRQNRVTRAPSSAVAQARRCREWAGLSAQEILARHPPGTMPPLKVLELLINLFNKEHTALYKKVSFKTRQERAQFLRRFFYDLQHKAGFKTPPDPRKLGHRHVKAVVAIWQQEKLAPATIQTYFSYLRGFELWIGKPGLIRPPAHYGLKPKEYQRHQAAERDKSWSGNGIDAKLLIARICEFDQYMGAALKLMETDAMRKKEALMFRPHRNVVPFEATGLPLEEKKAGLYARIASGAKGGRERFVPLDTPEKVAAIEDAKKVVLTVDGHVGGPSRNLKQAMRRFDYVMWKFGITQNQLGATSHGLRHEALIDEYQKRTGEPPPVRGGAKVPKEIDSSAREDVARLAGHSRPDVSAAYIGSPSARARRHDQAAKEG